MDVKNAFLHGDLNETVYMTQLACFVDKSKPNHVCLLHKSINGLKQSPRAWFDKFSTFLLEFGFFCSKSDPSLFIYAHNNNLILLLLYVDDMVITGNSSQTLSSLLAALNKEFRMTDMGQLHYFLGIQVQRNQHGLFMSQQKYAEDLLWLLQWRTALLCQLLYLFSLTEFHTKKNLSLIQLISGVLLESSNISP